MGAPCVPLDAIFEWDVANWSRCLPYWEPWLRRLDTQTAQVLALGHATAVCRPSCVLARLVPRRDVC